MKDQKQIKDLVVLAIYATVMSLLIPFFLAIGGYIGWTLGVLADALGVL